MPIQMVIGPKGDPDSLMLPEALCDHCKCLIEDAACGVCLWTVDTRLDNHKSDLAFVHNTCAEDFKAEYILASLDVLWKEESIEEIINMLRFNLSDFDSRSSPPGGVMGIPRFI